MGPITVEVSSKGKWRTKPAFVTSGGDIVVADGSWIRTANVHDEEWLEHEARNPDSIVKDLRQPSAGSRFRADVFNFGQRLPHTTPRHQFLTEWQSVAVIPLDNPTDWWENKLPQETRKNVRRAGRRGVEVRVVEFNDALLQGIADINNESPMRQGKPFYHFGKDLEAVRKDYSSFLDRALFIGAFQGSEMIGLIQLIKMGEVVAILQLLAKSSHYDKRPANALIAKAVELCAKDGHKFLTYGRYTYGNKGTNNPLTEFKRRNGFEEFRVPRYYVPLTLRGRLHLAFKLHRGVLGILPERILLPLLNARKFWYRFAFVRRPV